MSSQAAREEEKEGERAPVLRVGQLEAAELDEELFLTTKQALGAEDLFKYLNAPLVQKYHLEIYSALKFVIWYYTYHKTGATIGQAILEWSYKQPLTSLRRLKTLIYCCVFCFDELLIERIPHLIKKLILWRKKRPDQDSEETQRLLGRVDRVTNFLNACYQVASLVNYMLFLRDGHFLHVFERVLRLRPFYDDTQYMRETSIEITEREVLWQTYFSVFTLADSIFNIKKLYNKGVSRIEKWLGPPIKDKTDDADAEVEGELVVDITQCGLCEQVPVLAHQSKARDGDRCEHVFCYHCIQSKLSEASRNRSSDEDAEEKDEETAYRCPKCSKSIYSIECFVDNENLI